MWNLWRRVVGVAVKGVCHGYLDIRHKGDVLSNVEALPTSEIGA